MVSDRVTRILDSRELLGHQPERVDPAMYNLLIGR